MLIISWANLLNEYNDFSLNFLGILMTFSEGSGNFTSEFIVSKFFYDRIGSRKSRWKKCWKNKRLLLNGLKKKFRKCFPHWHVFFVSITFFKDVSLLQHTVLLDIFCKNELQATNICKFPWYLKNFIEILNKSSRLFRNPLILVELFSNPFNYLIFVKFLINLWKLFKCPKIIEISWIN